MKDKVRTVAALNNSYARTTPIRINNSMEVKLEVATKMGDLIYLDIFQATKKTRLALKARMKTGHVIAKKVQIRVEYSVNAFAT